MKSQTMIAMLIALGVPLCKPVAAALEESADAGRVCIAPLSPPTDGEKSLANPRGGDPNVTYSVRINHEDPIVVSTEHGQWVTGLSTTATHVVSVYADRNRIASFKFTFPASANNQLCVWRKSLYGTWQVWPLSQSAGWCKCELVAGSPNSALNPSHSAVTALAQNSKRRAAGRARYAWRWAD